MDRSHYQQYAKLIKQGESKTALYRAVGALRRNKHYENPVNIDTVIKNGCGVIPAYLYLSVSTECDVPQALKMCRESCIPADVQLNFLTFKHKELLMNLVEQEIS